MHSSHYFFDVMGPSLAEDIIAHFGRQVRRIGSSGDRPVPRPTSGNRLGGIIRTYPKSPAVAELEEGILHKPSVILLQRS